MPVTPTASPDDIEMSSIAGALKKSARNLVVWTLLSGAATLGVLSMLAEKYQSQAELTVVAKSPTMQDPKSTQAVDTVTSKLDPAAINTHVKQLQGADLLTKVSDELKLKDKVEFNAALGPADMIDRVMRLAGLGGPRPGESERDRVLNTLRYQLEVYAAKESRFIGIRVNSSEPQLAADIANKIAETYRDTLAKQGVGEIDDQQTALQGKIDKLKPELAAAEIEADRYRGQINIFRGGQQGTPTTTNDQAIIDLSTELTKAKAARAETEARAKNARDSLKLGFADTLPDAQKSPLIQNLVQQRVRVERQISELSASLLPGHPRMQQLNGDLAGLKKQLAGEISKLVDSLEKEAKVSQGREDALKKSLDESKAKVVDTAPQEAKLRELDGNVKAKRTELENIQNQIEANRKKLDQRTQPVEVQIISKAQAASVPFFPKKIPMAALVALASLLFGTAWTVTKALFVGARSGGAGGANNRRASDHGIRAEPMLASASRDAKEKMAAVVPMEDAGVEIKVSKASVMKATAKLEPVTNQEGPISSLARRIALRKPASGGHRTIICGETGAINAAQEAIDLGKSLSDGGTQVVVVDWAPSGRGISGTAGVADGRGLTELLLGEVGFEDAVKKVPGSAVHFIGCGSPLDNAEVEADQLNLVLDALDEAYDYIIVTGGNADARLLFEAIQGRFDAGVVVTEGKKRGAVLDEPAIRDPEGTFLGFEVSGIDVIRFERAALQTSPANQRMMRATRPNGGEARLT